MKRIFCLAVLTVMALVLCTGAQATTTFWFGDPTTGAAYGNDIYTQGELSVYSNNTFQLAVWCATTDSHSAFDIFVGFDLSSATTCGAVGSGTTGKLTLTSTLSSITSSINPVYDEPAPTVMASARESNNTYIGGRPYGIDVIAGVDAGSSGYLPQNSIKLFTFSLHNNMVTHDDYAWVVISNDASSGGKLYTSLLAMDTDAYRDGYALKIVTAPEPSSFIALGGGLLAFGGLIRRRGRRSDRK
jgi:hypothetical protein